MTHSAMASKPCQRTRLAGSHYRCSPRIPLLHLCQRHSRTNSPVQSLKAPRAAPEPYTKVVMDNLVLLRGVPPATAVLPATTLRVGRPQAARHPTPTRQLPAKLPPRRRRHSSMDGDGSLPSRRSRNSTMGSVAKAKPSPTPASPRPPSHPRRRHSSAASAATSPASSRRSSYSRPRRTNASTPRSLASSAGRALLAAAMGEPQRPPPSASGGGAALSPRRHRMSLRAHEKMLAAAEAGTGTGTSAASGGEGAGMMDEGVESPRRDQAPWSPRRPAGGWHTDRTTRGARRRQPVPTRAALGPSAPLLTITPRSPRLVFGRMDRFPRQHAAAMQQPLF